MTSLSGQVDYLLFVSGLSCALIAIFSLQIYGSESTRCKQPWAWLAIFNLLIGIERLLRLLSLSFVNGFSPQSVGYALTTLALVSMGVFGSYKMKPDECKIPKGRLATAALLGAIALGMHNVPRVNIIASLSLGLYAAFSVCSFLRDEWRREVKDNTKRYYVVLSFLLSVCSLLYAIMLTSHSYVNIGHSEKMLVSGLPDTSPLMMVSTLAEMFVALVMWNYLKFAATQHIGQKLPHRLSQCAAITFFAILAGGWLLTVHAGKHAADQLNDQLIARAVTASAAVQPDYILKLKGTTSDVGTLGYEFLKRELQMIRAVNPDCRYTRLICMRKAQFVYIVDAESKVSDQYTPPGTILKDKMSNLHSKYTESGAFTQEGLYDRQGTLISGFTPIRDPASNEVIAMLRLDVDSSAWTTAVREQRQFTIVITALLCGFALMLFSTAFREFMMRAAESERKYRNLVEAYPDWVTLFDSNGYILTVNGCGLNVLRASESDVIGKAFIDLWPKEVRNRVVKAVNAVLRGQQQIFEADQIDSAGQKFSFYVILSPLADNSAQERKFISISIDVTERKKTEELLRIQSSAINAAGDMIVITDEKARIEFVNPAFERETGYVLDEVKGQTPGILKSGKHDEAFYHDIREAVSNGETWHGEVINRYKDGAIYTEDMTITPVKDESGQIAHFIAIKRNITENKLYKIRLARAEAANEAKSQFVANMSHEIRTPLNGVIGTTDLLLNTELSPNQCRYVDVIRSSGETLLSVVNDILDFSKIEAKKLQLESIEFDLYAMVEDFSEAMALRAQEKGLEMIADIHPDTPRLLIGDPCRLRQILTNLVGNAIKFTEEGEIAIAVNPVSTENGKAVVRFEVRDTGVGMSKESQKSILSPFAQADGSITRKYGGTGLGLTISKQLAEMMGGMLDFESEIGMGSTFWFTTALDEQEANRTDALMLPDIESVRTASVLVVDRSKTSRLALTSILDSWVLANCAVASAEDAVEQLRDAAERETPYRVVIIDAHLPDTDCLELCRRIKTDNDINTLSLIAMIRLVDLNESERYTLAGYDYCLPKPVGRSALYVCIVSAISSGKHRGELAGRRKKPQSLQPRVENRKFRILLAEDNPTNQMVAEAIIEGLGYRLSIVANGAEAVKALTEEDYDLVFLDCQMPVMDGYTATATIRDGESGVQNPGIPIIALTANAMESDKHQCMEAGMDDYLTKPVTSEAIAAMLNKWLPVDSSADVSLASQDAIAQIEISPDDSECPVFDERSLLSRMVLSDLSSHFCMRRICGRPAF